MDELSQKSLLALEQQAEVERQRRRRKIPGLSQKTFQGFDADQGQLILGSPSGGLANASDQGSLSNAAISVGKAVFSYGWQTADWKPTVSTIGREDISIDENQDGPDGLDGDGGGGGRGTGAGNRPGNNGSIPQRCNCMVVWVRGTPKRPPADPDKAATDPIPGLLEYEFFNVTTDEWLTTTQTVASPFTLATYGQNNPNCNPASRGGCIVAEWDGGAAQITGTAFAEFADNLAVRDLEFTPDTGFVELTDGPPSGTDPGDWWGIKVCDTPPTTSQEISGDRVLLSIFNGSGNRVSLLGYDKDTELDVYIRCEEAGPP